jgi:hypothetical protein
MILTSSIQNTTKPLLAFSLCTCNRFERKSLLPSECKQWQSVVGLFVNRFRKSWPKRSRCCVASQSCRTTRAHFAHSRLTSARIPFSRLPKRRVNRGRPSLLSVERDAWGSRAHWVASLSHDSHHRPSGLFCSVMFHFDGWMDRRPMLNWFVFLRIYSRCNISMPSIQRRVCLCVSYCIAASFVTVGYYAQPYLLLIFF